MLNKNFYVLISVLAAFAIAVAACGGNGSGLRAIAPLQAGSLTTDYTIFPASGKAPSSELSFTRLSEPVEGENGVARFRVNG